MERKLFEDFRRGAKEQTVRNQMALIEAFFQDVERAVTGFDTD